MTIPAKLIAYLIYFKDFTTEEQAAYELGEFYKSWSAEDRDNISTFVSRLAKLDEVSCRREHITSDNILDREIVKVKYCSSLYQSLDRWLSETQLRYK